MANVQYCSFVSLFYWNTNSFERPAFAPTVLHEDGLHVVIDLNF